MFRNRKVVRIIAIFFILEILLEIGSPYVAMALTSGPTAPEYTSFEPVDTTNMVDLTTGDFVYNLPLLEVPGPAGGYPLSLSYHSGIKMNQDASWVGLGWTLNAGAINRTVNAHADDHMGAVSTDDFKWSGGETKYWAVGFGVPGVMAGVTYAQDTYKGSGWGNSLSLGIPVSGIMSVGITASHGPYGSSSFGLSAGISPSAGLGGELQAIGANLSVSKTWDLNSGKSSTSFGIGVSTIGIGVLGASISTSGHSAGYTIGGIQLPQVNKGANDVKTKSSGFSIPFSTIGFQKVRYNIDSKSDASNYGALYTNHIFDSENNSFDSYPIFDRTHGISRDPEVYSVGSLPAYDDYVVLGQGIGGIIQPYIFDFSPTYRQDDDNVVYNKLNKSASGKVHFRFKNDPSNYLINSAPTIKYENSELDGFENDDLQDTPDLGYNQNTRQLGGSRHIEWFTNKEVIEGQGKVNGLIRSENFTHEPIYNALGTNYNIEKQIGAYKIVNNTGVSYHYSIPVYAYDEMSVSESIDDNEGIVYHKRINKHPYAYTWLLTAVTGPDYVDINDNGIADDGDWGYWVNFDYGKWASEYAWRNPYDDMNIDLQQNLKSYSRGKKELYYLNSIRTASHTALFAKEIKNDGKGRVPTGDLPTSTLKLTDIYLFKNNELDYSINTIKSLNDSYNHFQPSDGRVLHNGNTIIDINDVNQLQPVNYIKRVKFNYGNYDLCTNTPNSYNLNYNLTNPNISQLPKTGKLNLTSISMYGHVTDEQTFPESSILVPDIKFSYTDNNPQYDANARDLWGYYKSDKKDEIIDENVDRMTTWESAEKVDAWSLSEITTPIGSKIKVELESDIYKKSQLMRGGYRIINATVENEATNSIKLHLDENGMQALKSLNLHINSTDKIDISILLAHPKFNWDVVFDEEDFKCIPRIKSRQSEYEVISLKSVQPYSFIEDGIILVDQGATEKLLEIRQTQVVNDCPYNANDLICIESGGPCYGVDKNTPAGSNNVKAIFIAGIIKIGDYLDIPGGGLRVKSIVTVDPIAQLESKSTYSYISHATYSSGVTSYEPNKLGYQEFPNPAGYDSRFFGNIIEGIKEYRNTLVDERKALQQMNNIPGPGVHYGRVVTRNYVRQGQGNFVESPNYTAKYFKVFSVDNTVKFDVNLISKSSIDSDLFTSEVTITDNSANIGLLTKSEVFDLSGRLINKMTNTWESSFKPNESSQASLGQVEQVFYENKKVFGNYKYFEGTTKKDINNPNLLHVTKRIEQPHLLLKTETEVFKSGLKTIESNLSFDLFSGEPLKTIAKDSYGNYVVTESTPAYKKYPAMRLAIYGGRNMLSQTAASTDYIVDNDVNLSPTKLLSASVQTWSNITPALNATESQQDGIWRKHRSYSFIGDPSVPLTEDGLYPYANFASQEFTAWGHNQVPPATWQKNSEITLYDVYSHALEASDVNGNYAATKFDSKQEQVYATVANAHYNEFAYTGAEDQAIGGFFGGDVEKPSGTIQGTKVHTGKNSIKTTSEVIPVRYTAKNLSSGRGYRASIWATKSEINFYYKIGSSTQVPITSSSNKMAGEWYLHNVDINYSGSGDLIVWYLGETGQTIYWDDFRFHPIDAAMTSYVYSDFGELEFILDANNLFTRYEYNAMGQLIRTFRESFKDIYDGVNDGALKVTENEMVYSSMEATLRQTGYDQFEARITGGAAPYQFIWSKDDDVLKDETIQGTISTFDANDECGFKVNCVIRDRRGIEKSLVFTGGGGWTASQSNWPVVGSSNNQTFTMEVNTDCPDITYKWERTEAYSIDFTVDIPSTGASTVINFPECGEYMVRCKVIQNMVYTQTFTGHFVTNSHAGEPCNLH